LDRHTGQSLNIRYKEHVRDIKNNREELALAIHPKIYTPVWSNGKCSGCHQTHKGRGD
jgi:hypothetical protein